jgi:hypothetical protein
MQASPKKFMVGDLARISSTEIQLDELSGRSTSDKVLCECESGRNKRGSEGVRWDNEAGG